jgi:alpha-tubulin suppressor-like RCC1 family protein
MFSVIGFVILKNGADKAATAYTKSLKSYLGQVSNATSLSTASPVEIKNLIADLEKPELENIPLGSISGQYVAAKDLEATTETKLEALDEAIDGSVAVYDYMKVNNETFKEISELTGDHSSSDYAAGYLAAINKIKVSIDKNKDQAPAELKVNFDNLSKACDDIKTSYTAWIDATKSNNKEAAAMAMADYSKATEAYSTESKPIIAYYADISKKLISSASDLNTYINTVVNPISDNPPMNNEDLPQPSSDKQNTTSTSMAGKDINFITAGSSHACAITTDKDVFCWGSNGTGELGNNSSSVNMSTTPMAVYTGGALNGKKVEMISAGYNHTCVITTDELAYCWGYNAHGELGNNSTTNSFEPVAVDMTGALKGKKIRSISAGGDHTCAMTVDAMAYCWGNNYSGQLGDNTTTDRHTPVAVYTGGLLNDRYIDSISAGGAHSCVVVANQYRIYCWGENTQGQLGNGLKTNSSVAVAVGTGGVLYKKIMTVVASGNYTTCAKDADGYLYCWGFGASGEMGNGTSEDQNLTPLAVTVAGVNKDDKAAYLEAGFAHICEHTNSGRIYCWGYNGQGALGINSTELSVSTPTLIADTGAAGDAYRQVAAGAYFSCMVESNSRVYCWGSNQQGQLGNGTTTRSLVPVPVKVE